MRINNEFNHFNSNSTHQMLQTPDARCQPVQLKGESDGTDPVEDCGMNR